MAWKVNTAKVRGRLRENGLTIIKLADAIGITETSVRNKLTGKTAFTVNEVVSISNVLNDTPLIFFALDVNESAKTNQSQ
jgi:transcriptional regulator with XRE-family HTH domain